MTFSVATVNLRRFAWRVGRRLYSSARGETKNDPQKNGEYWLLENVVRRSQGAVVLLDVGANKGNWTLRALSFASGTPGLCIHAFEPCTGTCDILASRCAHEPRAMIHNQGMSDTRETQTFYSNGTGSGTNSLHPSSGASSELVQLITCDEFLKDSHIARVAMLKVDTEGFDLSVLRGAALSLTNGCIDVVQFEYNWRWLLNHVCLRDVFELIDGKPYSLGKLTGSRIEFYDEWHPEMDRFFENNYVLVRKTGPFESLGVPVSFDSSNVAVPRRSRAASRV